MECAWHSKLVLAIQQTDTRRVPVYAQMVVAGYPAAFPFH